MGITNIKNQALGTVGAAADLARGAATGVGRGVKNGALALASGIQDIISFNTDPSTQKKNEAALRSRVNRVYDEISVVTNRANTHLEGTQTGAIATLNSPINGMKGFRFNNLQVGKYDGGMTVVAKRLGNYHQNIIVDGEAISRKAGALTHALTRAALSPVRLVAKLLQIEVAGALVQNSVALAVGFAVRGIVLALTQTIGHIAPYAITAAALAAAGAALAALAVKVSPFASVAVVLGLAVVIQQIQIAILGKNQLELMQQSDRQSAQLATLTQPSILGRAATAAKNGVVSVASTANNNKGKIALAAGLAVTVAAAYYIGPSALSAARGMFSAAGSATAPFIGPALPTSTLADKPVGEVNETELPTSPVKFPPIVNGNQEDFIPTATNTEKQRILSMPSAPTSLSEIFRSFISGFAAASA